MLQKKDNNKRKGNKYEVKAICGNLIYTKEYSKKLTTISLLINIAPLITRLIVKLRLLINKKKHN